MYRRSDEGKIIDPPVIPERERELYGVMESEPGNTAKIERLTRAYEDERTTLAEEEERAEREAAEDQAAADAAARQAVADRNQPDREQMGTTAEGEASR
jgi:hypothetical protein